MATDDQPDESTRPFDFGRVLVEGKSALLVPGTTLDGRYLIEKELNRGGAGVVYLARDRKLDDKLVVIKVLLEKLNGDDKAYFERKFKHEIKALTLIDHPGVVGALDVGELPDGRSYLVMQYVSGVSLRSVMQPQGIEPTRVANLVRQIGQALNAAHEKGVIHRDLKPENIMLQSVGGEEYVKLIDFGIATIPDTLKSTNINTTEVAGTPHYMAPEQFEGKPQAASDIYAFGVITCEMLTGRQPLAVKSKPYNLPPNLPEPAHAVILKALASVPQDRYRSAKEFSETLAKALLENEKEEVPYEGVQLAHVLFSDLVGYSKLTVDEQTFRLDQLQAVVREAKEFQRAHDSRQLIRLPTGDGMALVFFGSDPLAAVKCAVEIARALRNTPNLELRMGVHTGLIQVVTDINDRPNVSGDGINMAQRVMDYGDAGHILLSKTVADVLRKLSEWSEYLLDLGEWKVKHGERIHIFNLCESRVERCRSAESCKIVLWKLNLSNSTC